MNKRFAIFLCAAAVILIAGSVKLCSSCGDNKEPESSETIRSETTAALPSVYTYYALPEGVMLPTEENFVAPEPEKPPITVDMSGINSSNAALLDAETGAVISELNGDERIYPASMTKIMTAILAIEYIDDMDEYITILPQAVIEAADQQGSLAGFLGGESITGYDLLYGMLLPSGCECCITSAIMISGSEDAFTVLMNEKASEIGMTNTHFANSTGLHNENHYSTVHDMALLLRYAFQNDTFRQIDSTPAYTATNGLYLSSTLFSTFYTIFGTTDLTGGRIIGGKTGTTDQAGSCLCSYAEINGKEYVLCTANAAYKGLNVQDAGTIYDRLADATFTGDNTLS